MNDTARRSIRRRLALNHEIFRAYRQIELSGGKALGTTLEYEIEFYRECEAVPATLEEPGEPAQYAIASVTAVEYGKDRNGFRSTTPTLLPTPAWLEELLIECIDEDSLAEDGQ